MCVYRRLTARTQKCYSDQTFISIFFCHLVSVYSIGKRQGNLKVFYIPYVLESLNCVWGASSSSPSSSVYPFGYNFPIGPMYF